MKKKDIVDLIISHYEDDPRLFFRTTLKILKEFKADGDKELFEYVSDKVKQNVKIAPKREYAHYEPEIEWEEAKSLGWVPQEKDE